MDILTTLAQKIDAVTRGALENGCLLKFYKIHQKLLIAEFFKVKSRPCLLQHFCKHVHNILRLFDG